MCHAIVHGFGHDINSLTSRKSRFEILGILVSTRLLTSLAIVILLLVLSVDAADCILIGNSLISYYLECEMTQLCQHWSRGRLRYKGSDAS